MQVPAEGEMNATKTILIAFLTTDRPRLNIRSGLATLTTKKSHAAPDLQRVN